MMIRITITITIITHYYYLKKELASLVWLLYLLFLLLSWDNNVENNDDKLNHCYSYSVPIWGISHCWAGVFFSIPQSGIEELQLHHYFSFGFDPILRELVE